MSHSKLNIEALMTAIENGIHEKTGIRCSDIISDDETRPAYLAEFVEEIPVNTKTMSANKLAVQIHCMASNEKSAHEVYELIEKLHEAFAENIKLPDGFELTAQSGSGIKMIKTDEVNQKHAAAVYHFMTGGGSNVK